MRNETVLIFLISMVISIGIVSAAYYFTIIRPTEQTPAIQEPAMGEFPMVPNTVQNDRSDKIIKCLDPEIGEFYTNATTCEKADLNQRLSFVQTVHPQKMPQNGVQFASASEEQPKKSSGTQDKPDLRSPAKQAPRGLTAKCRFPVGQAAELERRMSGAKHPGESIWLDDYCRWRDEVRQLGCEVPNDFFYYSSFELCRS